MNHGISQGLVKLYRQKCNNTKKKMLIREYISKQQRKRGGKEQFKLLYPLYFQTQNKRLWDIRCS